MLQELDGTYRIVRDVQLAGLIEKGLPKEGERPGHLWPSEICNPAQAYYERTADTAPKSDELQLRLQVGSAAHRRFPSAARKIPECHGSEAPLDGAVVGLPGIKGKIDIRMGDALVEFKTSPFDVQTPEDVWTLMPQNVVQLLVYAAIWSKGTRRHLLVVQPIVEGKPLPLRAFYVDIKDLNALRQQVEKARDLLWKALADKTPAVLGQCAYYDNHCQFQKSCHCGTSKPLLRTWFEPGVTISRAKEVEAIYQKAWEEQANREDLHAWELAVPRKFHALVRKGHDHFAGLPFDPSRDTANRMIGEALARSNLLAKNAQTLTLEYKEEPAPTIGFRWISIPKTSGKEVKESLAPLVIRSWSKPEEPTSDSPSLAWAFRQVASLAAYYGKREGYVALWCQELKPPVRVFEVELLKPGQARDRVFSALQDLRKSLEWDEPNNLPPCPDFVRADCKVPGCSCPVPTKAVPAAMQRKPLAFKKAPAPSK